MRDHAGRRAAQWPLTWLAREDQQGRRGDMFESPERLSRLQTRAVAFGDSLQRCLQGVDLRALDTLLAVISVATSMWFVAQDSMGWNWWVYLLGIATGLPLIWRRRMPFASFLLSAAPSLLMSLVAHTAQPVIPLYTVLSIYTVAALARDWQRWLALSAMVVANILFTHSVNGMLVNVLLTVGSFAFGSVVRELRNLVRREAERSRQLERQAATEAARATVEERARIARDMHDILAHAVSLMVIQAEAGPVVVISDPARATAAFEAIAESGRDAMAQLRRMLGVLKEDGHEMKRAPQPGAHMLPQLVDGVRQAGIAVELTDNNPSGTLPADVDAALYRIAQEALTNVLKHSTAATVTVRLTRTADELTLVIADDGTGRRRPLGSTLGVRSGRGLIGIRERATSCGGSATTGPGTDGRGFTVTAQLPVR
ncbi:sensor histidine kinase [Streptomyces sp. NPDC046557]|uniref:sensor histidine kinase n=1 Tax=Streptomyces sp. NPDC046557 TaxID=3155372 RepID=UPI00340F45D6